MTNAHSPRYDWQAIELDYKAGVLPLTAICSKHGCSLGRLQTLAKRHKWERSPPPNAADVHGVASSGFPNTQSDSVFIRPDDVKKAALLTAAAVIDNHRMDTSRLRHIANLMTERLGLFLAGTPSPLPLFGKSDSAILMLQGLTKTTVALVQLERQAYGLEAMNPGNPADSAGQFETELENVRNTLEELTRAKIASK